MQSKSIIVISTSKSKSGEKIFNIQIFHLVCTKLIPTLSVAVRLLFGNDTAEPGISLSAAACREKDIPVGEKGTIPFWI